MTLHWSYQCPGRGEFSRYYRVPGSSRYNTSMARQSVSQLVSSGGGTTGDWRAGESQEETTTIRRGERKER